MTTPEGARAEALVQAWLHTAHVEGADQPIEFMHSAEVTALVNAITAALSRAAQGAQPDDHRETVHAIAAARLTHPEGAQPVGTLDHADRWARLWGLQAARSVALFKALRRAHACATIRDDGTCNGCFVSEALATPEPQERQPEGEPRFPYQQPDNSGGSLSATLPEAPEGAAARLREGQ